MPDSPAPASADPAFPRLHTRPARHWLNDPNGLSFHDGRWQVFGQHNPDATAAADICWWHADSADLLHWRDLGVALQPSHDDARADRDGVWSGNAVSHDGILHAFYCGFRDGAPLQPALSATSADGVRFDAPGTVLAGAPDRLCLPDGTPVRVHTLRDPFVYPDPGSAGRWSMLMGAGLQAADGRRFAAVVRHTSTDLTHWTYAGIWHHLPVPGYLADTGAVDTGEMWECPAFAQLPGDRNISALIVCPWYRDHFPGRAIALLGAAIGDRFEQRDAVDVDGGDALYAPSLLSAPDGRVLMWGWAREQRPLSVSQAAGWAGALTFPRELSEVGGRLRVAPAAELTGLRQAPTQPGARSPSPVPAMEIELSGTNSEGPRRLDVSSGPTSLPIAVYPADDVVTVAGHRLPLRGDDRSWWVRVLLDGSVVEAFTSAGRAATTRSYPGHPAGWSVTAGAGTDGVRVWELGL